MGLGLLPRSWLGLRLRLSLLYPPFLLGVRLRVAERGVMERRAGERDLEIGRAFEASEYGDRVRGRPLDGDLEAMVDILMRWNVFVAVLPT